MQRRHRRPLAAIAALATVASLSLSSSLDESAAARTIIWGASAFPRGGESEVAAVQHLETAVGQQLRVIRRFEQWDDPPIDSFDRWIRDTNHLMMLSVKPKRSNGQKVLWSSIANAQPGSAVHNEMVKWGKAMKDYRATIYLALHHEPEAEPNKAWGTADEFKAAFRAFVDVIRDQGATNVKFILIMTSYSFEAKATDRRNIDFWYPGDSHVDAIGGDAYNWDNCRGKNEGWMTLQRVIQPMMLWGKQHPSKELWLPEWGSVEDPNQPGRKAQWLNEARSLLKSAPYSQYRGAAYFHNDDQAFPACDWWIDTSTSAQAAFAAMGNDAGFGGTSNDGWPSGEVPTADQLPSRGTPYTP